jgi:hypothetical protein
MKGQYYFKYSDSEKEKKRALIWWNSMNLEEKFYKTIKHNELIGCDRTRHPDTLTDREIEIIYNADN